MLNFTAGLAGMKSALTTAQVKRVVTARRLVELARLRGSGGRAWQVPKIVYLEDVRKNLSLGNKLTAVTGKLAAAPGRGQAQSRRTPRRSCSPPAPKASPRAWRCPTKHLLANVAQVRAHIDLYDSDVLFNPLPVFHCFGLTCRHHPAADRGRESGLPSHAAAAASEIVRRIKRSRRHHPALHRHLHHPICPRRREGRSGLAAAGGVRRRAGAR